MIDAKLAPIDYEEIEVGATAAQPSPAKVSQCDGAKLQFSAGSVRYRLDGSNPTPTYGRLAWDGREEELSQRELIGLRMIRENSINGLVNITYYVRH